MRDVDKIFGDDYECEGQLSISDIEGFQNFEAPITIIATSKVFARAIKQMNLTEWKTFIFALTQIRWTESNGNIVKVDKHKLAEIIGIGGDSDHFSVNLRRSISGLKRHSGLSFSSKDKENWEDGDFIRRIGVRGDLAYVVFDDYYLPLFSDLQHEKQYITLWAEDLFQMRSERTVLFYESLRLHSDTRKTNTRVYSIRDMKQMFEIPKEGKGSYMRANGHFDRSAFEKRIIEPLCEDLKKCKMIKLHILEDGRPWRKIKEHGRVRGYEFSWDVSNRPSIATAEEKAKIRDDVDKNPRILKVAKDLLDGEKKPKTKKNNFHNYEESNCNVDEIMRTIMARQDEERERHKQVSETTPEIEVPENNSNSVLEGLLIDEDVQRFID